jgi:hypothetical protein
LHPGYFLNGLPVFYFTNFAGTILNLIFEKQRIKLASKTNAKYGFEE